MKLSASRESIPTINLQEFGASHGTVKPDSSSGATEKLALSINSSVHQRESSHGGSSSTWVQAAELKELKEFTSKLKTLPQIQRHIELLTSVQAASGKAGFKERVSLEQELLDDVIVEPACQFVEVSLLDASSTDNDQQGIAVPLMLQTLLAKPVGNEPLPCLAVHQSTKS